ncbi:hypothetical protein Tco_1534498, partial [Tanacetum coccineum]
MAGGVRIDKGPALKENEIIVQHTTPALPSNDPIMEKSDHQKVVEHEDERVLAAKRKAQAAKSKAANKCQNKKITLKAVPALITLLPPTTVIPDNVNVSARDRNQILQDAEHEEKETRNDSNLAANDMNEEEEINSPHSASSPHSVHSTHSDPPIFESTLVEKLAAVEREKDDPLDQNKAQREKIQQLEEALISKDLYLSEEKISVDNLRGNLECLTTDLAQTE